MEGFQHLVEAKPQRMKAVVKTKTGIQPGSSTGYRIKWPVSVCAEGLRTVRDVGK